ncbi:RNA pyrophosphohydrolase [Pseudidiomarina terrestris]|uniref:RNA pyrophosphohydrolase n=1 Tax=Pseudidiomarina terrestris TaxID=2820060 RepID=A0AAW7QY79_9GAMM|nr:MULTISPECIES: RNA pyrophosphohydrolase [unclassified Pseudidiomarina]MDN7124401.1 RNA pyrophosphohydrolase [Pseudidiomarina sp. 1APP75-32.1]MDN7126402.1 RNA pyrophosphohydrolase [Pseudidiomarina sp. 1APR75-33.1]MDN7129308.1 RNA pyrophosphohydrolase [Pseudidiomarina sp. 1APR75-15]MDN7134426.1 RNA pyrophosphohydrolase [Pseudidiomarina sp. 1ASP75-5]MDN7136885.1 RNA pyrophosphohydrolase [Pseudidiomarina sp. 1ASP75-14]
MIDAEGFRANVGIIICNDQGQVFWARRYGQHSWQFPQGGIDDGETPEQTMYRELWEEVGLKPDQVEIVYTSRHWFRYRLPKRLVRREQRPTCIGQKQKWFLLRLTCKEQDVNVLCSSHPEFDDWRWVSYWYPVRQVVSFKKDVYRRVMKEFAPIVMPSHPAQGRPGGKRQRGPRRKR